MVSDEIRKIAYQNFQAGEVDLALVELDRYGHEMHHKEIEKVHETILTISNGDLSKLKVLVDVAVADYRDVLVAAHLKGRKLGNYGWLLLVAIIFSLIVILKLEKGGWP